MAKFSIQRHQELHRAQAGKNAYRRFAQAMGEFREAIAEMEAADKSKQLPLCEIEEVGTKRPKKIVTPLRANGYRPLSAVQEA